MNDQEIIEAMRARVGKVFRLSPHFNERPAPESNSPLRLPVGTGEVTLWPSGHYVANRIAMMMVREDYGRRETLITMMTDDLLNRTQETERDARLKGKPLPLGDWFVTHIEVQPDSSVRILIRHFSVDAAPIDAYFHGSDRNPIDDGNP